MAGLIIQEQETNRAHSFIVLHLDTVLHPRLHVKSDFLCVMCSQMQNVNVTPLTAPGQLQCLRPQGSCQLSGLEHIFHQEVGLSRQQLSQRVCAEAGLEIRRGNQEVEEVEDAGKPASALVV